GAADAMVVNPVTTSINDNGFEDAGTIVAQGNAIFDVSDSPGDGSFAQSITAVNGLAGNVDTNIAGAYGTLFVGSDGFYRYTANSALDLLQVGTNPTEQFTITV